jgi:hypothetical protein
MAVGDRSKHKICGPVSKPAKARPVPAKGKSSSGVTTAAATTAAARPIGGSALSEKFNRATAAKVLGRQRMVKRDAPAPNPVELRFTYNPTVSSNPFG